MRSTLLATLFLALAGCSGAGTPGANNGAGATGGGDAGEGGTGGEGGAHAGAGGTSAAGQSGASQGGASQGGAGTLAEVQAIFDAHCVTCHDKSKLGLPAYPALSLVAGDTRDSLVNRAATEPCGGTLVVPGAPQQSYLIRKLSDATPCEGSRMPRPFEIGTAPPLSSAEMTTIERWISAGAP